MSSELTDKQIERQDEVDNFLMDIVTELLPEGSKVKKIKWDIEIFGKIRDAIQEVMVDDLKLCTEMEFYPYL